MQMQCDGFRQKCERKGTCEGIFSIPSLASVDPELQQRRLMKSTFKRPVQKNTFKRYPKSEIRKGVRYSIVESVRQKLQEATITGHATSS
jgi:hypothetical protein